MRSLLWGFSAALIVGGMGRSVSAQDSIAPDNKPRLIEDVATLNEALAWTPNQIGRRGADLDFDGAPTVTIEARIAITPDSTGIFLCLYMHAKEPEHDYTEVGGWSRPMNIYEVTDSGYTIAMIMSEASESHGPFTAKDSSGIGIATYDPIKKVRVNPLLSSWQVYGDHNGMDVGTYTRMVTKFHPVVMLLETGAPRSHGAPRCPD